MAFSILEPRFAIALPGRRRRSRVRRLRIAAALAAGMLFAALSVSCRREPAPSRASSKPAPELVRPDSAPPVAAKPASTGYALTPAETAAVDEFLRRHPTLRTATDADRRTASDGDAEVRSLYGIYHPYFVRGDLNDDGVLDFVMAFVRRDLGDGAPWFSVVVFLGRGAAGGSPDFSSGTFIERDATLARGDLSVDRDSIVITPDTDDDAVRRYRWDPPSHAFRFVPDGDDDDADSPSVSRTAQRPAVGPPAVDF